MNYILFLILLISLIISILISIWVLKKWNRWWGMVTGFFINTVLLGVTSTFLYKIDAQVFLKETSGLVIIMLFIPINTWINFFILGFIGNREVRPTDSNIL